MPIRCGLYILMQKISIAVIRIHFRVSHTGSRTLYLHLRGMDLSAITERAGMGNITNVSIYE